MKVAIIDKVGSKAGIDHYDNSLLTGLMAAGDDCYLYSNFDCTVNGVSGHKYFHNVGVGKVKSIFNLFIGFFRSILHARFSKVKWVIFHIFTPDIFDFVALLVSRILGFKIIAIVHDIESLEFDKIGRAHV